MEKLKVGIIGIGSIGEFHAREFHNAGCEVSAILTSSEESSVENAKKLKKNYGINARPYYDLNQMLENENLDIMSICSPAEFHAPQIKKCLEFGINVLSEKPFVFDTFCDNYKIAKDLFNLAKDKRIVLSVNTQLVSILDYIPKNQEKLERFYMYMEPSIKGEMNLMKEAVPHMNSILIKLKGNDEPREVVFENVKESELKIDFYYGSTKVQYEMKIKKERPRRVVFSINDLCFERVISEGYKQFLKSKEKFVEIEDPLSNSIKSFIGACRNEKSTLVTDGEILENVKLQDFIIKEYILQHNKL